MRRPTPLPPPPVEVAPRRAPRTAVVERGTDAAAAGPDEVTVPLERWGASPPIGSTDAETLPVGDIASAGATAAPTAPATTGAGALTGDEAPVRLGLGDVWRAARARRKALRAEVRRFTVRQRRRRLVWTAAAASVVLLGLGTLGAAYSPLLAVERVRVVGTQGLDAGVVEAALAAEIGTPLPLVEAGDVKAALVAFPLVESFSLEARPPHELVVRIVERTPVGVVESDAGYTLVDAAGIALATTPSPPQGQPLLEVAGGVDGDVFAAVGAVVRALPTDLRVQLTGVSATSVDDVTLVLGGSNAQIVWGGAEDSALKVAVVEALIRAHPLTTMSVYDVSTPEAVVVR